MSGKKQMNIWTDPETREAIEALRANAKPIPSVGQVVRRAVLELYAREMKPEPERAGKSR